MQYEEEGERLKDESSCNGLRADLKMCLLKTDCCKIDKITPRECLKMRHHSVPTECFVLKNTFFECKRSLAKATKNSESFDDENSQPISKKSKKYSILSDSDDE